MVTKSFSTGAYIFSHTVGGRKKFLPFKRGDAKRFDHVLRGPRKVLPCLEGAHNVLDPVHVGTNGTYLTFRAAVYVYVHNCTTILAVEMYSPSPLEPKVGYWSYISTFSTTIGEKYR